MSFSNNSSRWYESKRISVSVVLLIEFCSLYGWTQVAENGHWCLAVLWMFGIFVWLRLPPTEHSVRNADFFLQLTDFFLKFEVVKQGQQCTFPFVWAPQSHIEVYLHSSVRGRICWLVTYTSPSNSRIAEHRLSW